jgi:hypothetical protein
MASVNKVILVDRYNKGESIPELSEDTGISISSVRTILLNNGAILRTRADGVRNAAKRGRLSGNKGVKRTPFSKEWRNNISNGRLRWGKENASGVSLKPSGYVEITRGKYKGIGYHRALMEIYLGR